MSLYRIIPFSGHSDMSKIHHGFMDLHGFGAQAWPWHVGSFSHGGKTVHHGEWINAFYTANCSEVDSSRSENVHSIFARPPFPVQSIVDLSSYIFSTGLYRTSMGVFPERVVMGLDISPVGHCPAYPWRWGSPTTAINTTFVGIGLLM